jgi:hypothetical protein
VLLAGHAQWASLLIKMDYISAVHIHAKAVRGPARHSVPRGVNAWTLREALLYSIACSKKIGDVGLFASIKDMVTIWAICARAGRAGDAQEEHHWRR